MGDMDAENFLDHVVYSDVETALNKADDRETVITWLRDMADELES